MYDRVAIELASRRHGVVGVHELRAAGMTPEDVRQLRGSRHWESVTGAVLRRRGTTPTDAQRLAIAVLDAGRAAALSHLSAARAWGASGCPPRPIHVVKATQSTRRSTGAVVHRVRRLPDEWVTELDAIPIVRPELCALQIFAVCRYERGERLVERMWSDRSRHHTALADRRADAARRAALEAAGLRVVEVWDTEVWTTPHVVVARVRRAITDPFRVSPV